MTDVDHILHTQDWNFADVQSTNGIHNIHPYPAKFIPQIPRRLMELFPPENGSLVLDPFCGSGTTLVEATELGLDALGIDLHPLACLIASVKVTPLPISYFDLIAAVVERARSADELQKHVQTPDIPNVDHWFKPDIQRVLTLLTNEIRKVKSEASQNALKVALSSIIVQVSNQESDTRYAAVDKNVTANDVYERFKNAAFSLGRSATAIADTLFAKRGKAAILNRDILEVTPDEITRKVGLVVTSPPYPNAYEYWLYHKYRMYWLGMDPVAVKKREIGARAHYFTTNPQDETDFEKQMSQCFLLLSKVMLPSAKACFVVGRSVIHGRRIDNVALLQRAASPHGFVIGGIAERQILKSRKSFNLSHAKINTEHIVVFCNQNP